MTTGMAGTAGIETETETGTTAGAIATGGHRTTADMVTIAEAVTTAEVVPPTKVSLQDPEQTEERHHPPAPGPAPRLAEHHSRPCLLHPLPAPMGQPPHPTTSTSRQ